MKRKKAVWWRLGALGSFVRLERLDFPLFLLEDFRFSDLEEALEDIQWREERKD